MMLIRPFHKSDMSAMVELIQDLGYMANEKTLGQRYENFAQNPDYQTIVVEIDGQLVGMIALIKLYGWELDSPILRIHDLVVKQGFQRKGIGERLINEAKNIAKMMGAKQVVLNSGNRPERMGAHNFYPKMGFEITSTFYRLWL